MRRIVLGMGTLLGAVLLAGCPPAYPKCSSDDQCKEHGEVCVEGQCQECAADTNCKEGFVCKGHKCVPKAECAKEGDCPSGKKCEAGRCVVHECDSDKQCPKGSKCLQNQCIAGACSTNDDCPSGQECQGGTCQSKSAGEGCNWGPIRFDFNDSSLTSAGQSQLKDLAECIKKEKGKIRLEGHADERGTEEYNIQLSNRRAASVRKYLVDLGVSGKELTTVGYGKNRPAMEGHTEEAWAANRRVEFNRK